jgi:c-di-GMP-binding flagellar brake protein YcgR
VNLTFDYLHSVVASVVISSGSKFRLLQRMTAERATVILTNGNSGVGYESTLLWVDEDASELVVDEPVGAIEALTVPGAKLRVFGELGQGRMSFRTSVLRAEVYEETACLRLRLPRWLYMDQRRTHTRYFPNAAMPVYFTDPCQQVPVYLVDDRAHVLQGEIKDISLGGLCIRIDAQAGQNLRRGLRIPSCTVSLPGRETLQSSVEIRYLRPTDGTGHIEVGGRFLGMTKRQRARLAAFVTTLPSA